MTGAVEAGIMRRMAVAARRAVWMAMAVALAAAGGVFAQDAAKGAALLAEARKAVGGEERLAGVRTIQAAGDFKRIAGQNTIEGSLELRLELPGRLRRDEDLSPPGGGPAIIRTEVLNGTDVWDENTGGGPLIFRRGGPGDGGRGGRAPIDPGQLRELQLRARQADLARWRVALLLSTSDPVTWIGTAEAPDGRADVLEITPAEGAATRLFLDAATHLPLMLTWQGVAPRIVIGRRGGDQAGGLPPAGPQQATLRMTLGEYRTVDGIRLPHLITRGVNDETIEEWAVDRYRLNPSFRADTFVKR